MKHLYLYLALLAVPITAEAQEAPPVPSTIVGAGQIGRAFNTRGTVTGAIQRRDFPIYTGTPTYLDQWVRTLEQSQSGFRFFDDSRLDVGPVARVKIDKAKLKQVGAFSVSMRATRGSFRLQTSGMGTVRTPYATVRTKPGTVIEAVIVGKSRS